jgi:hypothetical protein
MRFFRRRNRHMTENDRWDDESPSNHLDSGQGETVGPTETGPSLEEWKNEPEVEEPEGDDVDWAHFDSLSIKDKQRVLGVPVTGVWGNRSKAALKERRGDG